MKKALPLNEEITKTDKYLICKEKIKKKCFTSIEMAEVGTAVAFNFTSGQNSIFK